MNSPWKTLALLARSEDRAADAHVRCSKGDGGLEILAHAHAQASETELTGELSEKSEVNGGFFLERRDAHQAGHIEPELITAQCDEPRRVLRRDAGFLRFLARV